jgi:hypothetical protein
VLTCGSCWARLGRRSTGAGGQPPAPHLALHGGPFKHITWLTQAGTTFAALVPSSAARGVRVLHCGSVDVCHVCHTCGSTRRALVDATALLQHEHKHQTAWPPCLLSMCRAAPTAHAHERSFADISGPLTPVQHSCDRFGVAQVRPTPQKSHNQVVAVRLPLHQPVQH